MSMDTFLFILEIIGTVAFALSGAMLGLKKDMDLFGVLVMGITTACGGGALRDLFLDRLPPAMFREPVYPLTAIGISLVLFIPAVYRLLNRNEQTYEQILRVADAIGLGAFTAAGVSAVFHTGNGNNVFFAVFLGTITGVGGGVMRDILAGQKPVIFVKHVYACAALAGAVLCVLLWRPLGQTPAMLICVSTVFLIRMLAARFRWSLPKAPKLP